MPTTHELKTDPLLFEATYHHRKTHEIRFNNRGYEVDDFLVLRETLYSGQEMLNAKPLRYTGRACKVRILHILDGGYGLHPGWVILSHTKPSIILRYP